MKDFKELVIEKESVFLENKDKSDVYEIIYDKETEEFTLKHFDKKVKTVKKFETIHKYFEDLAKPKPDTNIDYGD